MCNVLMHISITLVRWQSAPELSKLHPKSTRNAAAGLDKHGAQQTFNIASIYVFNYRVIAIFTRGANKGRISTQDDLQRAIKGAKCRTFRQAVSNLS